ncbi:MAG: hypothetical protein IH600_02280 [Bacteroidetes bacterium]|nr:hypothetical protein [Bacteroidota bacterium]
MKHILFSALLAFSLVLSACESQSDVNGPITSDQSLLKAVENLNLSNEQLAQIDEMFWLEEDMSMLLNATQANALDRIVTGTSPHFAGPRDKRGIAFDMGALVQLRLILKANPELSEASKQALLDLIKASNAHRLELIETYKDNPEELRAQLKAEHDALILAMNGVLTESELQALEDLKAEIKRIRDEMRDTWVQLRVDYQVTRLTSYLSLSETQAQDIKTLLLTLHQRIQELRDQFEGDPEGFRDAVKALLQETDAAIVALLDEQQAAKWQELKIKRLDWRRGHGLHG